MTREPIAIVGLGCVFPDADSPRAFWRNVAQGHCASRQVPEGRWAIEPEAAFDPEIGAVDKVYSLRGCFLDSIALNLDGLELDASFVEQLDPVFHLLLSASRTAVRDGVLARLNRPRTAVVVGNIVLPTESASHLALDVLGDAFERSLLGRPGAWAGGRTATINRYAAGLPAGVLAKGLGLGGGTFTLDAACASSLYSLKLASDMLEAGKVDAVLAGGVSRPDSLYTQMGFAQLRALSPSGVPRPFDARADGLVVGEGAGVFVLKRLSDAIRDEDDIRGVLTGFGLSNDVEGRLLAPSSEGQLRAMRAAYRQAGWKPSDVDLIECHATGTLLGDAVEYESMRALWADSPTSDRRCVIGSAKSNIGHLLTAAGSAGLMKVLFAMREKTLPPTANFEQASNAIPFADGPFEILTQSRPWNRRNPDVPRRAAISAFGFGGINAHVLVEEWSPTQKVKGAISGFSPPLADIPIAIVGIGLRLPHIAGLSEFRRCVMTGEPPSAPTSPRHWWGVSPSAPIEGTAGSAPLRGWAFDSIEFPTDRFRIPPKELPEMLPQQLLMLDAAADALEDAGWDSSKRLSTGVFIGLGLDPCTTNFHVRWSIANEARSWAQTLGAKLAEEELDEWIEQLRDSVSPPLTANRTMGALGSIVASRIAREFQLGGTSFTVSSEESSGLRALEQAVSALRRGDLDAAVVGAVDLSFDPRYISDFQSADSTVWGEGALSLVLMRLSDAVELGATVRGIIDSVHFATGPRVDQQRSAACESACERANIKPDKIGLVALSDAELAPAAARCFLDSTENSAATTTIESLVGRSGPLGPLAAVVQTASCLQSRILPAGPGNVAMPAEGIRYWLRNRDDGPRRAAVLAEGVDGSTACVLLSEHEQSHDRLESTPSVSRDGLFAFEGRDVDGLIQGLVKLKTMLDSDRRPSASMVQAARQWRREHPLTFEAKLGVAFIAGDREELQEAIRQAEIHLTLTPQTRLAGPKFFYAPTPLGPLGQLAFVFPGSGSHYAGMGRELALRWPQILDQQDEECGRLRDQIQPSLFWNSPVASSAVVDSRALILGQVSFGVLVSDLLQAFGVRPKAVLGYSLGETTGLFSLRAWTARDEMLTRMNASTLFTRDLAGECLAARKAWNRSVDEPFDWHAGSIGAPAAVVSDAIGKSSRVLILIVNTPDECVIGGEREAVLEVASRLGVRFHPLEGVSTVHCELARPVQKEYRELHLLPTTPPTDVRFYSSAWGGDYALTRESAADCITAQAVASVDFPAVVEAAYRDGVRLFVEIGPGAATSRMIRRILGSRPHYAGSAAVAGKSEVRSVLDVLATLTAERVPVRLELLDDSEELRTEMRPHSTISIPVRGDEFRPPQPPIHPEAPQRPMTSSIDPAPPTTLVRPRRTPMTDDPLSLVARALEARGEAHDAFLSFTSAATQAWSAQASFQASLLESAAAMGCDFAPVTALEVSEPPVLVPRSDVAFDRDLCIEYAIGSIERVLGPDFAEVDSYPTRVRLPDEPLMLVDRIVSVQGEPKSLGSGMVVTEHDVLPGAWYLDFDRIPTCIAVEAGQADLFLSGYLGIDFWTKGRAVYRLLDAVVTFHRGLPGPGSVIHYEIHIDHFFRQGDTQLFRFRFEGTVAGEPLLTMRDGCAGFFSEEELSSGKGIVHTELDRRPIAGVRPADWKILTPMTAEESYSTKQLDALREGNLAVCFGPAFANLPLERPIGIPAGPMRLIDRIVRLEPTGGRFGLGRIRADFAVRPDAWFLTCHFVDDQVMPGTLMYECCLHTLRVFLLRMGWVGESDEVVGEPVPGVASRLKCRGQVTANTRTVEYEISIKELGYNPDAFVIADALMYADGKAVVQITDMSYRLTGLDRDKVESYWEGRSSSAPSTKPILFSAEQLLAFSVGNPSEAFGEPYKPFDRDRVIARLPGPPYQFMDRVVEIRAEPWKLQAGSFAEAEYDVPPDAWYFEANGQPTMPFAVLLEIALQPCGWMSAYLGSALTSDVDMHYRNLGGSAVWHEPVFPDAGTLTMRTTMTKCSSAGGMLIQNFEFEVLCQGRPAYTGDTYFGFFTKEALATQVGVRDAKMIGEGLKSQETAFPVGRPFPEPMLRMVDSIEILNRTGGPFGKGWIRGTKHVDPTEWFFKAHFHQDPVCPGSLGLEAFLQLLKVFAADRWGEGLQWFQTVDLNTKHQWIYRGQVVPTNGQVAVEAWIKQVDDSRHRIIADGLLSVDGLVIYQMNDFSLRMVD